MSDSGKLYLRTTSDCELPLHVTPNGVAYMPAQDIPQLFWPDGTVCWIANLYLLKGFRSGKSRKNGGGTLLTWAKHLSHLLRYCALNKLDILDLSESHFRMFINVLLLEKHHIKAGSKKRDPNQVGTICRTVLNFLAFVDERHQGLNLLGPTGRIHAEKKTKEIRKGGKTISITYWSHDSIPDQRESRRRKPISSNAVEKLYETNALLQSSSFITRRRYAMLRLLEITGGRRIEVAYINVKDLEDAEKTGMLTVFTAKQRKADASRQIPVTQADLKDLISFVNHYRRRIIRNTIGISNDHGRLFISEPSGMPLEPDTLGSDFYDLRIAAGIVDEEACMHAFRHRYITNIFRALIRTHHFQAESDLRRALLSTETLKRQVMEWTGHSNIESLDHYIHLAFEAESEYQTTLDLIGAQRVVQSLRLILKDFGRQLAGKKMGQAEVTTLFGIVDAASTELDELLRSKKNHNS